MNFFSTAPNNTPQIQGNGEMKSSQVPEKARLMEKIKQKGFHVPDFIYISPADFKNENFGRLKEFLDNHRENFKVIVRSAHPQEEFFKGGTFDSLATYADIAGIQYARKRIISLSNTAKRLSILRQQKFSRSPEIDPEEMGILVMPFISGSSVMAKMIGNQWEFGYCRNRAHKIQRKPYITKTPHDRKLLDLSDDIQRYLGFRCEIEYIIGEDNEIYTVQAKDISQAETDILEYRAIRLDGIRRIRRNRNYRERPVYLMDKKAFYVRVITKCEEMANRTGEIPPGIKDILEIFADYEAELEAFALQHERFGVIEISPKNTKTLYQQANHCLDIAPDLQKQISKALTNNLYQIDYFLSEADTLIAKDRIQINLGSHDAYGIDTVRNPVWSAYWHADRHDEIIKKFKILGFKTGDTAGIEIDTEENPLIYRL